MTLQLTLWISWAIKFSLISSLIKIKGSLILQPLLICLNIIYWKIWEAKNRQTILFNLCKDYKLTNIFETIKYRIFFFWNIITQVFLLWNNPKYILKFNLYKQLTKVIPWKPKYIVVTLKHINNPETFTH